MNIYPSSFIIFIKKSYYKKIVEKMDIKIFYAINAFLLGLIVMFVLLYLLFYTKTFIYTYCANTQRLCYKNDYLNDPTQALEQGYSLDSILYIQNDKMFYHRPHVTNCSPDGSIIQIQNPQQCLFSSSNGNVAGHSLQFNSTSYLLSNGITLTDVNGCIPKDNTTYTDGIPILAWSS
jgi:hypothetical protein